jgi:hypothetical protein
MTIGQLPLEKQVAIMHDTICRGVNKEGKSILPEEEAQDVKLIVYKDGVTQPLCPFYEISTRCSLGGKMAKEKGNCYLKNKSSRNC